MKKISTAAEKAMKNFGDHRLTIGLTWAIDRAGIACWRRRGKRCWNKG
jgi:hypothetical protein